MNARDTKILMAIGTPAALLLWAVCCWPDKQSVIELAILGGICAIILTCHATLTDD